MAKLKFILSQAGSDDPQTATSGCLLKGSTYEIVEFNLGDDFTVSGAPNNNIGTKFIANGIEPFWNNCSVIGWNNTPTVIIRKNNIGDVWFERNASGDYLLKSNGLFKQNKTFIPSNRGFSLPEAETDIYMYAIYWVDENTIRINVCDDLSTVFLDDSIRDCPFTIEVFKKAY